MNTPRNLCFSFALLLVLTLSGCGLFKGAPAPEPLGRTGLNKNTLSAAWNAQAAAMGLPLMDEKSRYPTGGYCKNCPSSSIRNYPLIDGRRVVEYPGGLTDSSGRTSFTVRDEVVRMFVYLSDKRAFQEGKPLKYYDVLIVGIEIKGEKELFRRDIPRYTEALIRTMFSVRDDLDIGQVLAKLNIAAVVDEKLETSEAVVDDMKFIVEYKPDGEVVGRGADGRYIVRNFRHPDKMQITCRFEY